MTRAQRYFYNANGYVVLPGVLARDETQRLVELADSMDADDTCTYKHDGYPKRPTLTILSRCVWYHPALLQLAMDERILPIMKDIVGGEVRLEEHQYLITYPDPGGYEEKLPVSEEGWHRGIGPSFGSFEANGQYHCLFSKAFIYLTDNGPNTGTWVIPGSHRLELPARQLRTFMDGSLAVQEQAQAGDILILSETLIHAGPRLRPGVVPRYSLVFGYSAPFMQTWTRYDPPDEVLSKVTPEQRQFLTGEVRYGFRQEAY